MSKKADLQAELTKRSIAFEPTATNAELEALLPPDAAILKEPEDVISLDNLQVGDPQVFKPAELPLVIKPPAGQEWLNPQQAQYAKVLNAAAYANKNWEKVKDTELARLVEIGTSPDRYYDFTGEPREGNSNISYDEKKLKNILG